MKRERGPELKLHLPRWISRCGALSRRAAEQAVTDGRVQVDGRVVRDVLRWVNPDVQAITLDGQPVKPAQLVWLALHKRRGTVTTTADPEGRPTVLDDLKDYAKVPGIAPVGRLDLDSAGLLLLTNDHLLAAALLDPATHVAKRYRVKVAGHPDAPALTRLRTASLSYVEDGRTVTMGPADAVSVHRLNPASAVLDFTLSEGKNRQLRRMCEAVGHPVEALLRLSFGPIDLGALAPGEARPLTADEVAALRRQVTPQPAARPARPSSGP